MNASIHRARQSPMNPLGERKVAVVGFGSQGRAHAHNLRDSGVSVLVGARKDSPSGDRARSEGFEVVAINEAVGAAQVVAFLVPDQVQKDVYETAVAMNLRDGSTLLFAHGFNIHFGRIVPPADADVVLVAPKAPGPLVRRAFVAGEGVPALAAVDQDVSGNALETALAYAGGIGCLRAGVIETTFAEETETDLFGEQAVLCGGVSRLIELGFETLTENGYQPEVAYFECLHELKLIVDLLYEGGFTLMRDAISDTAEFGDLTRGLRVIGHEVKQAMEGVLKDIVTGSFAREWTLESETGSIMMKSLRRRSRESQIETVGAELRELMRWTSDTKGPA